MAAQDEDIGTRMYELYNELVSKLRLIQINKCSVWDLESIDDLVEYEMMNQNCNFDEEEERFVEEKLLKDPKIKRPTPAQGPEEPCSSGNCQALVPVQPSPEVGPASTAGNSRQARKIGRAKANYLHQHVSSRLSANMDTLDNLRKTIKEAQSELLETGLGPNRLRSIRSEYGLTQIKKEVERMKKKLDLANL